MAFQIPENTEHVVYEGQPFNLPHSDERNIRLATLVEDYSRAMNFLKKEMADPEFKQKYPDHEQFPEEIEEMKKNMKVIGNLSKIRRLKTLLKNHPIKTMLRYPEIQTDDMTPEGLA